LKDYVERMEKRYQVKVKIVRSDDELFTKRTRAWLRKKAIDTELSAPRTQDQNGLAERSGGVVIAKARAMRIGANLPHDLWKEMVNTAAYLHNRTPRENLDWKTPYEVFYTHTSKLSGLTETINMLIDDLRAYINDLTPTRLAKRGLGSEIFSLANEFQASTGVVATVKLHEHIDEIGADLGRDLVQIAHEALANVAKHASASRVVISLRLTAQSIRLEVADDGTGMAPSPARGRGLPNMLKRVQAWGGKVEIGSAHGTGTAIRVWIPARAGGSARSDPTESLLSRSTVLGVAVSAALAIAG